MRILLADDDGLVRGVIAAAMRRRGHEVTEAMNGQIAIHLLEDSSRAFDAVVTDGTMPEAGGIEVLKAAIATHRPLALALLSGESEYEEGARVLGATFYIKPLPINIFVFIDDLQRRHDELVAART